MNSSSCARKIRGAKTSVQNRSHSNVPNNEASTRPTISNLNWSSGNGERWMAALTSGSTFQAQRQMPPMLTKSERKSAWFSDSPFIQGRPL